MDMQKEDLHMIKEAIMTLTGRENLSYETAETVMDEIMSGAASAVQMAAYLAALAVKGETIDEITASAASMRRHGVRLLHEMEVLEIVGTGGDKSNSFNISTTSAFVVSAAGIPVAKHGNRAASSKSGAADVLEALGVNINLSPEQSKHLLEQIGICFLFAQNYHQSMKHVAPVRKELAIRTIFNILGPLSNPAGANLQLLGVFDASLLEPLARVMVNLGVKRGMVVYGQDGLDEISMSAPTSVCEFIDGVIESYVITPEQYGFPACRKEDLLGGIPEENARITRAVLTGAPGPQRNTVVMNAAAAIHIAKPALSLEQAIVTAQDMIDSGKAMMQLDKFIASSQAVAS
jgi:anthranilate phosphoribosyltransferase